MKLLLALALPLFLQQAPRPAWEIAPRWVCEMDKLRICQGLGGRCEIRDNSARFGIDFPASRFGALLESDPYPESRARRPHRPRLSETIVGRHWFAPSPPLYGDTKIVFDSGDSATLAPAPRADGETLDAIVTRNGIDSQYHFYGTCRPGDPNASSRTR